MVSPDLPDIGELYAKGSPPPPDNIYTGGASPNCQDSLGTGTSASAATWRGAGGWGGANDAFLVGPFKLN